MSDIPEDVREAMARAMFVASLRDDDSMDLRREEICVALSALRAAGYEALALRVSQSWDDRKRAAKSGR